MFVFGCIIVIVVSVLVFNNIGVNHPFSKGVGVAVALSVLAAISLGQNYTQSLIPEANDGMGISNQIAYWIIGEDGWSHELFRSTFELSLYVSLILILAYPVVLVVESKSTSKPA